MNTVCHISRVKEAGVGGRLYSGVHTSAIENGSVLFLGGLATGEKEIYQVVVPTTALIGKARPMIAMNAEIIYDEARKASGKLGNFVNVAGKAFPLIPLSEFDEIELSKEAFVGAPAVNSYAVIADGSAKWKVQAGKPTAGAGLVAKITSVRKSSLPVFVGQKGQSYTQAYDLFTLTFEIV